MCPLTSIRLTVIGQREYVHRFCVVRYRPGHLCVFYSSRMTVMSSLLEVKSQVRSQMQQIRVHIVELKKIFDVHSSVPNIVDSNSIEK